MTEPLSNVYVNQTTDLCQIMNKHGSDKGSGHHNYTQVYDILFRDYKDKTFNLLEIGIGSMDQSIASNMCGTPGGYNPGSSLRGWSEYFQNANIYGCDIDNKILFNTDRIKTFYMDQTSTKSVNNVIEKGLTYDIIIDDGLHYFPVNFQVMTQLYDVLNTGGIYVIEDIINTHYDHRYSMSAFINKITQQGSSWNYLQIPNSQNETDNNLFKVRKNGNK